MRSRFDYDDRPKTSFAKISHFIIDLLWLPMIRRHSVKHWQATIPPFPFIKTRYRRSSVEVLIL